MVCSSVVVGFEAFEERKSMRVRDCWRVAFAVWRQGERSGDVIIVSTVMAAVKVWEGAGIVFA